jgi:pyruvate/2-oxoglutarate dehydrogenase complex dihydrolipoamide acyltransferase (E2) component
MSIRRNRLNAVLVVGASIAMLGVGGDTALAQPWQPDDRDRDRDHGCVFVQTPTSVVAIWQHGGPPHWPHNGHPPFGHQRSDDQASLTNPPVSSSAAVTSPPAATSAAPPTSTAGTQQPASTQRPAPSGQPPTGMQQPGRSPQQSGREPQQSGRGPQPNGSIAQRPSTGPLARTQGESEALSDDCTIQSRGH